MIALSAVLGAMVLGQVNLRGGHIIGAPVVDISPDGVQVGGDEPRVIPWDQVRSVGGEWGERAEAFVGVSDTAWRARLRLARGDDTMALPLFEELFPEYRDRRSEQALLIAEGLYQCRYRAGDAPGAFEAWIVAADLRASGLEIAGDPTLRPLLDPETFLPRELAPIFIDGADARHIVEIADRALARPSDALNERVRAIVAAYRDAASQALGERAPSDTSPPPDAPEGLPATIVRAGSSDPAVRRAARTRLEKNFTGEAQGTWREAWARAAIGQSLLLEDDRGAHLSGVLQLLHLPARFADTHPYLSAVALARASDELRRLNDASSADQLQSELKRTAPRYDAIAWLDARRGARRVTDTNESGVSH